MTYIPDLSPCEYFNFEHGGHLLAVGWLDRKHVITSGTVAEEDCRHLKKLIKNAFQPVNYRGLHECNLCQSNGVYGSKNLFIPDNGDILVAPELIIHYINLHSYLPPDRFLSAMRRTKNSSDLDYKNQLLLNNGKFLFASDTSQ